MSPKFRGRRPDRENLINEWLDDEKSAGPSVRSRMKKISHARATHLPAEQANATVSEVYPKQCRVWLDANEQQLLCSYRRAGVLKNDDVRERTFVTVGDRVAVTQLSPQDGVVEGVCERRNKLFRPAPGKENKLIYHVIAANLDQVVIVTSAAQPEFSPGLADRFLVAAQAARIEPLICVSKMDLLPGSDSAKTWSLYRDLGFQIVEVSSKRGDGIDELRERLIGKSVLFCGHSGVGKTSLLRVLLKSEIGRVSDISEATGKGRHTTTSTVLLGGPDGSRWIDSPGVREFGLAEVAPEDLQKFYPEFETLSCTKSGCTHLDEASCFARALPRYSSYRRIYESLAAGEH